MADNVDIDLYAEDIEQDFTQEEFGADGLDLYDDVIASAPLKNASSDVNKVPNNTSTGVSGQTSNRPESNTLTCVNHLTTGSATSNLAPPGPYSSYTGRKYQLYVGNLTWWTTDQDITDAIVSLGIQDFIEVKFFENRSNGQSKGFCIVSFGSEQSMRLCMDKLPKKELHGQAPIVTYTSKQALNQFEAQTKARPTPTNQTTNQSRLPTHPGSAGINQSPRMIMGPPQIRNRMPPPGMNPGGPRVLQPGGPPHMGGPPGTPSNQQHMNFHNTWQNGIRQNGPPRPPGPPQQLQPQRPGGPPPGMYQGPPPPGQGIPPRGPPPGIPGGPPPDQRGPPPRPDWNRPPGMQNPGGFIPHQQGVPGMQNMPTPGQGPMNRGPSGPIPPPQISGGPGSTNASTTHSHVQSTFFPQNSGTAHQGPPHQVSQQGPPQGPPQGQHGPSHAIPPHNYHNGPPLTQRIHPFVGGPSASEHRSEPPALSEAEFEEIMSRNRTVSSSAIARAVSDAAAGEFASAIETLVTAISLIKQSKAANDDRCKILVSSLQDTLHGVETKSYGSRRDRSRSRERERAHRRSRRDRSRSREYRERSRERDRDRDRDRERDKERYYADNYSRERSRSRERDRDREYRERSREDSSSRQNVRPRLKSPEPPESNSTASKSRYYEERYRERDRERDRERERERERENSRREPERERDRERDRERERERAESSHRSSRH
uniref:Cleavage and polyadenylation specificity factor subunit 6 n=1 Tax=Panstrongylus megistus TaxID=65343 RepID=A0A069DWM7_9HEMI